MIAGGGSAGIDKSPFAISQKQKAETALSRHNSRGANRKPVLLAQHQLHLSMK